MGILNERVREGIRSVGLDPEDANLRDRLRYTKSGRLRQLFGKNLKVQKGEGQGVLTAVMHLAPAIESGFNTCPFATNCADVCIKTTGQLVTGMARTARVSKTLFYHLFREDFMEQLRMEDIYWYDYTKVPLEKRSPPSNYNLTFSLSEDPESMGRAVRYLEAGHNAAVVVQTAAGMTRTTAKEASRQIVEAGVEWIPRCLWRRGRHSVLGSTRTLGDSACQGSCHKGHNRVRSKGVFERPINRTKG